MCRPASMVVTKNNVFWGPTDSHEDIIEHHNLHGDGVRGPNFVRVEIRPIDGDLRKPLDQWCYGLDQDSVPGWYDNIEVEKRVRSELLKWAEAKLFVNRSGSIKEGLVYAYGNSTVKAFCNSTVYAYDNSTVEAYDKSTVEAYDNSTVGAYDNSTVYAYDNSTVKAYHNSTVEAYGNSTVEAYGDSTVKAYGNSTVKACDNYAIVRHHNTQKTKPNGPYAVMIDYTGYKAVVTVGE